MRRLLYIVSGCLLSTSVLAQKHKNPNYRHFDEQTVHFGFMMGANSANFVAYPVADAFDKYQLKALENVSQPGGQVGPVMSLKLGTPVLRLRFIPSISFQERVLKYYYTNPDPEAPQDLYNEERVNSTNLDFPLMLQFRTTRLNNFATYVLMGGQYSYDLQSQADASQSFIDPFIKIKQDDFQGQAGVGVEFFAPYFKFGMEIKYSRAFSNSFIQDGTPSSDPIDQLFNQVWWFSLIFEG